MQTNIPKRRIFVTTANCVSSSREMHSPISLPREPWITGDQPPPTSGIIVDHRGGRRTLTVIDGGRNDA